MQFFWFLVFFISVSWWFWREMEGERAEYNVKTWNIILVFNVISLVVQVSCDTMDSCRLPCRSLRFTGLKQHKWKEDSGSWDLSRLWSQRVTEPAISVFRSHMLLISGQNVHCLCQYLSPDSAARVCLQCCDTLGPVLVIFRGCSLCSFLVSVFPFKSPVKLGPSGIVDY